MENNVTIPNGLMKSGNGHGHSGKPKFLDQVRNVIRCKHYSIRTEQTYTDWIKRYIIFHGRQHPENMNAKHVSEFLTHLAVQNKVAASTQNQALCAIVFLYKEVLEIPLGEFRDLTRAKKPDRWKMEDHFGVYRPSSPIVFPLLSVHRSLFTDSVHSSLF